MKFIFKGAKRKVNVVFKDGDVIDISNDRSVRTLQRHPSFQLLEDDKPEPKKRGRKPKAEKEAQPQPEVENDPFEDEMTQTELEF